MSSHGCRRSLRGGSPSVVALGALLCVAPGPAVATQDAAERGLFDHAEELRLAGDATGALAEYLLLVERFPGGELVDEALLQAALVTLESGDPEGAGRLAERLIAEHPREGSAAGGQVVSALVARTRVRDREGLAALRDELARVAILYPVDSFPRVPWRAAAHVVAGELSLELGQPLLGAGLFAAAGDDPDGDEWRHRGHLGLARALLLEDAPAAVQLLQGVIDEAPEAAFATQARRLLGLVHRLRLRPGAGQPPWLGARLMRSAGVAFDRPVGVAVDAHGSLLVGDEAVPMVAALDAGGELRWRQQPMHPGEHPWFDRDGRAHVQTEASVMLPVERDRRTFSYTRDGRPRPVEKIRAGARTLFGGWALAHDDGDEVSLFDPEGNFQRSLRSRESWEIVDVTVDGGGRLYLLDRRGRAVLRYSAEGEPDGQVASRPWQRPQAVAVDLLGNVYVLDRDERRVDVLGADGRHLVSVGRHLPGGVELDEPRDIAVDDSGRLYVADRGLRAVVVLE